jgi:hypothetical protein
MPRSPHQSSHIAQVLPTSGDTCARLPSLAIAQGDADVRGRSQRHVDLRAPIARAYFHEGPGNPEAAHYLGEPGSGSPCFRAWRQVGRAESWTASTLPVCWLGVRIR